MNIYFNLEGKPVQVPKDKEELAKEKKFVRAFHMVKPDGEETLVPRNLLAQATRKGLKPLVAVRNEATTSTEEAPGAIRNAARAVGGSIADVASNVGKGIVGAPGAIYDLATETVPAAYQEVKKDPIAALKAGAVGATDIVPGRDYVLDPQRAEEIKARAPQSASLGRVAGTTAATVGGALLGGVPGAALAAGGAEFSGALNEGKDVAEASEAGLTGIAGAYVPDVVAPTVAGVAKTAGAGLTGASRVAGKLGKTLAEPEAAPLFDPANAPLRKGLSSGASQRNIEAGEAQFKADVDQNRAANAQQKADDVERVRGLQQQRQDLLNKQGMLKEQVQQFNAEFSDVARGARSHAPEVVQAKAKELADSAMVVYTDAKQFNNTLGGQRRQVLQAMDTFEPTGIGFEIDNILKEASNDLEIGRYAEGLRTSFLKQLNKDPSKVSLGTELDELYALRTELSQGSMAGNKGRLKMELRQKIDDVLDRPDLLPRDVKLVLDGIDDQFKNSYSVIKQSKKVLQQTEQTSPSGYTSKGFIPSTAKAQTLLKDPARTESYQQGVQNISQDYPETQQMSAQMQIPESTIQQAAFSQRVKTARTPQEVVKITQDMAKSTNNPDILRRIKRAEIAGRARDLSQEKLAALKQDIEAIDSLINQPKQAAIPEPTRPAELDRNIQVQQVYDRMRKSNVPDWLTGTGAGVAGAAGLLSGPVAVPLVAAGAMGPKRLMGAQGSLERGGAYVSKLRTKFKNTGLISALSVLATSTLPLAPDAVESLARQYGEDPALIEQELREMGKLD